MQPWEVEADGQIYIHEERWINQRHQWLVEQYPCPWGKWRIDITLSHPRLHLRDVPPENPNAHHDFGFPPHRCYYASNRWSTIFGAHTAHGEDEILERVFHNNSLRTIVESDNPEPLWGEPIVLLSTSSWFINEPWGRNVSNKFAFFRGRFWQIAKFDFLHAFDDIRGFENPLWQRSRGARPYIGNAFIDQYIDECWGVDREERWHWNDYDFYIPFTPTPTFVWNSLSNSNNYNGNPLVYKHGL